MVKLWTLGFVALWSGLAAAGPYDGWQPHAYCNALEGIEDTQIPALSAEQEARVESLQQVQVRAFDRASSRTKRRELSVHYVCAIISSSCAMEHVRRTRACSAGTTPSTAPWMPSGIAP